MGKDVKSALEYNIAVDAFVEGTQDGVKTFTYPTDHLDGIKNEIFGEEKIKQYQEAESKYFKDMNEAITELSANQLENEKKSEFLVKFQAAQDECEVYIKRDGDDINATFRAKSYRDINVQELQENIWDAVASVEGSDE